LYECFNTEYATISRERFEFETIWVKNKKAGAKEAKIAIRIKDY
jgi:hypothetical protein